MSVRFTLISALAVHALVAIVEFAWRLTQPAEGWFPTSNAWWLILCGLAIVTVSMICFVLSLLALPLRGRDGTTAKHARAPTSWVGAALAFAGAAVPLLDIARFAPHVRAFREPVMDALRSLRDPGLAAGLGVQAAVLGSITVAVLLIYGGCGRPARRGTPPPRTLWGRLLAHGSVTLGVFVLLIFWKGVTFTFRG